MFARNHSVRESAPKRLGPRASVRYTIKWLPETAEPKLS